MIQGTCDCATIQDRSHNPKVVGSNPAPATKLQSRFSSKDGDRLCWFWERSAVRVYSRQRRLQERQLRAVLFVGRRAFDCDDNVEGEHRDTAPSTSRMMLRGTNSS